MYFDTNRNRYVPLHLKDEYDSLVESKEGKGSKILTDLVKVNYKKKPDQ